MGTNFNPFSSNIGLNSNVNAITKYNPGGSNQFIAVGGDFTSTAGGSSVNRIAAYDVVSDIFFPFSGAPYGAGSTINAVLYDPNTGTSGSIYVGGTFSSVAGGVEALRIARYDIANNLWYALRDNTTKINGLNGDVYSIAIDYGNAGGIYVGGSFSNAGGIAASHIAYWNGSNWFALTGASGEGTSGTVTTI